MFDYVIVMAGFLWFFPGVIPRATSWWTWWSNWIELIDDFEYTIEDYL
jgi:hypothetical protein